MSEPNATQTATINIQGMTCQHCTQSVQRAVSSLPGVSAVNVDLAKNAATVTFNPASVTVGKVMQTIQQAGFTPVGFTKSA
ncbi:MAG TPA: cation transporter [Tepidisphaeraceae bacterium]|nr:cation transporter [Tepidisphaeraceae bacterium]